MNENEKDSITGNQKLSSGDCLQGREKVEEVYNDRTASQNAGGEKKKDFIQPGEQYGRLTAVRKIKNLKRNRYFWICECSCGNETTVSADKIRSGHTKSCGCIQKEWQKTGQIKHRGCMGGISPECSVWQAMIQRCSSPKDKKFSFYGGRGIKVSQRWLDGFKNFIEDMGKRPSRNHSLDRIDPNGDYKLENCRWATKQVQANNTRSNHFITIGNKRLSIADWSRESGVSRFNICYRINHGWEPFKAVFTPARRLTRK